MVNTFTMAFNYYDYWKQRHSSLMGAYYYAFNPGSTGGKKGIRKYTELQPYVHMMVNSPSDVDEDAYANAADFFDSDGEQSGGGCSGVVFKSSRGTFDYHARNLDWYRDNNITMVNRTPKFNGKHASIGVCLCRCTKDDLKDSPDIP